MAEKPFSALPPHYKGTSVRDLTASVKRLRNENQKLRSERNAECERADAAERRERDMRRELDGIRARMREAERELRK